MRSARGTILSARVALSLLLLVVLGVSSATIQATIVQAGVGSLTFSPSAPTMTQGGTIQLDIVMSLGTSQADTIDAYVDFDPTALEVVTSAGAPATALEANAAVFSGWTINAVDNTTGQATFSATRFTEPRLTGTLTAATLRLRSRGPLGSTTVRFATTRPRTSDLFLTGQSLGPSVTNAALLVVLPSLTVSKSGGGSGTVTSSPSGISCGGACSASFANGTNVSLTASPANGSTFAGWSGACTGTGSCVVTMNAAKAVTATFNLGPATLTITKAGSGSGRVTSNPIGIDCGPTCSAGFANGTQVTLTAAPAAGSRFLSWGGACTGSGACVVSMTSARFVTAIFNLIPPPNNMTVVPPTGPSSVPSLLATFSARPNCGSITRIQFGNSGVPFNNARVAVLSPGGGPLDQTSGFTYTPPANTTTVQFGIIRVIEAGGATVSPMVFTDNCGDWNTFVGGGAGAFR